MFCYRVGFIVRVLDFGVDVVIIGRCVDSVVVLGFFVYIVSLFVCDDGKKIVFKFVFNFKIDKL